MMVHDPNKRTNLAFLSHRLFYVSVLKSIKWSEKDREMRDVYLITSFLKNPFWKTYTSYNELGFQKQDGKSYTHQKRTAEQIPMENLCLSVVGVLWSRNDDITHFWKGCVFWTYWGPGLSMLFGQGQHLTALQNKEKEVVATSILSHHSSTSPVWRCPWVSSAHGLGIELSQQGCVPIVPYEISRPLTPWEGVLAGGIGEQGRGAVWPAMKDWCV